MRQILATTDLSLVESFRIAAESEGIETIIASDGSGALPFTPTVVAVADDADYDRAAALLGTLHHTPRDPTTDVAPPARIARVLFLVILLFALIFCLPL